MELLDEYDVFVCYSEDTGITWAESVRRVLQKRGYNVYVAHQLRHLISGNWQDAHDSVIKKCKIFILLNTLEALESHEIKREITKAFPAGDTSLHRFWILRDAKYDAPYNSEQFQIETGIDLSKQSQAPFKNESDLNSILASKCLDAKLRPIRDKAIKESEPEPPQLLKLAAKEKPTKSTGPVTHLELKEIDSAINQGSSRKALSMINSVIGRVQAPSLALLYNKALLLFNLGRNVESLELAKELIKQYPLEPDIIYLNGHLAYSFHNYSKAIELWDVLLDLNPNNISVLNSKSSALEKLGKIEESKALLERVISLNPEFPYAWYNLGVIFTSQEKQPEALEAYNKAIELDGNNAKALVNKGFVLRDLGRIEEAVSCYDRAMELLPGSPVPYYNKGVALCYMQEYKKSLTWFDRALKKDLKYFEAWVNRGVSFILLGNFEKGLRNIRHGTRLRPSDPLAYYNEGTALLMMNRFKAAENPLRATIALSPDNIPAISNLGVVLNRLGRYEEAARLFTRAIELEPQAAQFFVNRSSSLLHLEKHEEALGDCDRAIKLNPNLAEAHYNRAMACALMYRHSDSIHSLRRAIELDGETRLAAIKEQIFSVIANQTELQQLLNNNRPQVD